MDYRGNIKNDYKGLVGQPLARRRARYRGLSIMAVVASVLGIALSISAGIADVVQRPSETDTAPAPVRLSIPAVIQGSPVQETDRMVASLPLVSADEVPLELPAILPSREEVAPAPVDSPATAAETPPAKNIREVTVRSGDNLTVIFKRLGLSQSLLHQLLKDATVKSLLSRIHPGQSLAFELGAEKQLESLEYSIDEIQTLLIARNGDDYQSEIRTLPLERRETSVAGTITDSLFTDAQKAGLSDNLIMQLVDILGWDIDFALNIREGDQFTVLFEEFFDPDGHKVKDGRILATEFVNRGRQVAALRYRDPTGRVAYYSPDGHAMRKAFLRTPVKFTRISSRFSMGRWHPVLHRMRAHKGVDYAAPTGTPVKAAGDARVAFVGKKGGYGKVIILRHANRYSTLYGHLSRFKKGLRKGQRVRQGQVIGYVGSTGLATGPHLHYEFRVNGKHRDPLKVTLPKSLPLDKKYMDDFKAKTREWVAELEVLRRTRLALND